MADTIGHYLYTDDKGNQWRVRRKSYYGAVAGWGFAADDTSKPFKPGVLKERYVTLTDATSGRHRKVNVGNTSATYWLDFGASVTLPNGDGTTSSYTITGSVGEKWRKAV
jgi:hypothetical protein